MTNLIATPAKLRDGSWGARVQGTVTVGQTVTIQTKGGKSWDAAVVSVLWSGDGVSLCTTRSLDRAPAPARRRPMGAGHGWAAPVAGYSRYCTANEDCGCYDCAS